MRVYMVCCLLLIAGLCALARPVGQPVSPEEREALALSHEILCDRAMLALNLTDAQKAALLPILTTHVNDLIAERDAKANAQAALLPAMMNLRAAVVANNGVSDAVKGDVHRAEAPYKVIDDRLETQTAARAAQVWALLTTAQGARLRRVARNGADTDEAFITFTAPRLPRNAQDVEHALSQLYRAYGLYGEEITKAVAFGKPIFEAWQKLPRDQADAQRADVLRRLLALPDTGILSARPEPGTEHTVTLTVLTQKSLHFLNPAVPMPPVEDADTPAVQSTVADIRVMNLVNTLYLTPEQTRTLLGIQNRAHADYGLVMAKQSEALRAALPVLRQVRDAYAAGAQPDPQLLAQMKDLEQKRAGFNAEEAAIDKTYLDELKQLLTDNQVTMVANFVPCTVPVQSLTNPERVGQADNADGMVKALERLRAAPESRLPAGIARLQGNIKHLFLKKHYRDEQIQPILAKVPGIVADIRAMEDADFALKKKELAESISVPAHIAAGRELNNRIMNYLLAPNLTPLLQGRLGSQAT